MATTPVIHYTFTRELSRRKNLETPSRPFFATYIAVSYELLESVEIEAQHSEPPPMATS